MPSASPGLFTNVPEDHLNLLTKNGTADAEKVARFLGLKRNEVSKAMGVPLASVRYDSRLPKLVAERMLEWAILFNRVATHFEGDAKRTALWFSVPNPMFGNMSPKNMLRYGRYRKLIKFVNHALSENTAP